MIFFFFSAHLEVSNLDTDLRGGDLWHQHPRRRLLRHGRPVDGRQRRGVRLPQQPVRGNLALALDLKKIIKELQSACP